MIYDYFCSNCQKTIEIVKAARDYNREELCSSCNNSMTKVFTLPTLAISKTEFPEFNPAFGEVIKGKYHRKEMAKRKGMIEIGNENIDKIDADFTKRKEEDNRRGWENLKVEGI